MAIVIYVDDFQTAVEYYTGILGLQPYGAINGNSCFLYLGDDPNGIYLEGGYTRHPVDETRARLSFMLKVDSISALYQTLTSASVPVVQDAPKQLGRNSYWLQFHDPAGNILEAIGGA